MDELDALDSVTDTLEGIAELTNGIQEYVDEAIHSLKAAREKLAIELDPDDNMFFERYVL